MSYTRFTAFAIGAVLTAAVAAQGPQQPPAGQTHKPDHMDHRFDDPERYAKSFDDPAEVDDGIWSLYFCNVLLGRIDERKALKKGQLGVTPVPG